MNRGKESMFCPSCSHHMRVGILKDGEKEIKVWFCDCGKWFEVPALATGEVMIWMRERANGKKKNKKNK